MSRNTIARPTHTHDAMKTNHDTTLKVNDRQKKGVEGGRIHKQRRSEVASVVHKATVSQRLFVDMITTLISDFSRILI